LVIALVGYSLGAPQYSNYELEEEYEPINPEPQYSNNREYGNSQGQVAGTKGGRIQGQGAGTKGGRIQGHGNNQGQGEYRQPAHGGYHVPEQQYGNNPGYGGRLQQHNQGGRLQQYSQGGHGSNNQGYGFDRY